MTAKQMSQCKRQPYPESQSRLRANRANAQKSTGPKTSAGKANSRLNALKHGLLTREVVIRKGPVQEDPRELNVLVHELINRYQPRSVLERMLLDRIATCYWRLRRAMRYESAALERLHLPRDESQAGKKGSRPRSAELDRLRNERQETQAGQMHHRMAAALILGKPDLLSDESWGILEPAWRAVASRYADTDVQNLNNREVRAKLIERLKSDGLTDKSIRKELQTALDEYLEQFQKRVLDLDEAIADAEDAARREGEALERVLPDEQTLARLVRYESMIDRQLHRAVIQFKRIRQSRAFLPHQEKE